jgi:hypothetical protein
MKLWSHLETCCLGVHHGDSAGGQNVLKWKTLGANEDDNFYDMCMSMRYYD